MKHDTANARQSQEKTLAWLLKKAAKTAYGQRYGFDKITSPEEFRKRVPLVTYPDIREDVMKMVNGERDILWRGVTRRFAQSSGTSDGKSKFIPVTDDSLRLNHYRGGADVVAMYLDLYPDSKIFSGDSFILGGSFGNTLDAPHPGVKVGDLSAQLIDHINPLVNLVRVPSKSTALIENWEEKLPRLVEEAANRNITNISGVPSWFLTVLKEVMKSKGAKSIHDVWPNLEVFFHGGIAFGPYRDEYDMITNTSRMRYLETYNASEGFFAVQDKIGEQNLLLLMDVVIYYEFVPLNEIDNTYAQTLSAWEVE
ncbi:MAG: GH3 auxin-responsive promoter family protein, partial [Muribaculaceae bacterium]|nr:GH3 auxin-responsive promoter family protein [Muribaculaceae bacterium]